MRAGAGRYGPRVSTFITRLEQSGTGPRVAVKDLIDVRGVPTTAGSQAVARNAQPAADDAACLRGCRAAGARIVGKSNLHELAVLPFGTNPWYGTPENPLDGRLVPGGSSSGSAVAVATGEADVSFGTDTGGSVRIPAACCGVSGLKTSFGRVPVDGVWPLAPSLDTVGPLAAGIDQLVLGMQLLEPGFTVAASPARVVGRLRTDSIPEIEKAVDDALHAAGFEVVDVELPGWTTGADAFTTIFFHEFWQCDHHLAAQGLGDDITMALELAGMFGAGIAEAQQRAAQFRAEVAGLFTGVQLLALPTLPIFPPRLDELTGDDMALALDLTRHTSLFNVAGTPCTAQPIPVAGARLPASIQLVGPLGSEELLLPTAALVERSVGN